MSYNCPRKMIAESWFDGKYQALNVKVSITNVYIIYTLLIDLQFKIKMNWIELIQYYEQNSYRSLLLASCVSMH